MIWSFWLVFVKKSKVKSESAITAQLELRVELYTLTLAWT
jgi:hypothetical protein